MNSIRKQLILSVAAIAMFAAGAVQAQVRTEKNISLQLAVDAAAEAVSSCAKNNYNVAATVVDRAGQVRAQLRGDMAGPHTADTSFRKAYTAVSMRANSGTVAENVAKNPGATGLAQITDFIMLAGGVPIRSGNEVIGAIGVGGAPGGNLDEACANAGIEKIRNHLN